MIIENMHKQGKPRRGDIALNYGEIISPVPGFALFELIAIILSTLRVCAFNTSALNLLPVTIKNDSEPVLSHKD